MFQSPGFKPLVCLFTATPVSRKSTLAIAIESLQQGLLTLRSEISELKGTTTELKSTLTTAELIIRLNLPQMATLKTLLHHNQSQLLYPLKFIPLFLDLSQVQMIFYSKTTQSGAQ